MMHEVDTSIVSCQRDRKRSTPSAGRKYHLVSGLVSVVWGITGGVLI